MSVYLKGNNFDPEINTGKIKSLKKIRNASNSLHKSSKSSEKSMRVPTKLFQTTKTDSESSTQI